MSKLYRPKATFIAPYRGADVTFTPDTYVEEGHELLEIYGNQFVEVKAAYRTEPRVVTRRSVEQATAAPGEKR